MHSSELPVAVHSSQLTVVVRNPQLYVAVCSSQLPTAMHSCQMCYLRGALFFVVSQQFFCGALSLRDLTHTRAQLSCVGFHHVHGDKTWIDFFSRKFVGFSPEVGFPWVKSCVYCAWPSFYVLVVSAIVIFG
jgi:hypothetical protein